MCNCLLIVFCNISVNSAAKTNRSLLTMSMQPSSSGPEYLNRTRCRVMSAKYDFASLDVDVPKPAPSVQGQANKRVNSLSIQPTAIAIAIARAGGEQTWCMSETTFRSICKFLRPSRQQQAECMLCWLVLKRKIFIVTFLEQWRHERLWHRSAKSILAFIKWRWTRKKL